MYLWCLTFTTLFCCAVTVKFLSRIPQITASIQSPPLGTRQTPSHCRLSIHQAISTPLLINCLPTLCQCIGHNRSSFHPCHRKTLLLHSCFSYVIDHFINFLRELRSRVIILENATWLTAPNHIMIRVNALVEEAVIVIAKEATIKIYSSCNGRKASGELGAALGKAGEAIILWEITVALG